MVSRHLVDPELTELLEMFQTTEMNMDVLPALRTSNMEQALHDFASSETRGVKVRDECIPAPAGSPDVRVLVYQPEGPSGPRPGIFHIHGGGYVIGGPELNHLRNVELARDLDCVIVSVDYRLAPETPFPGPIEDCYTALKWMHSSAKELGLDVTRIGVAGESAGGGLAASLALLVRDRAEIPLAYQMLVYPMVDDRTCIRDDIGQTFGQFVWTIDSNRFGWSSLLGREPGGAEVSCYAAAARAEDLSGLPPAFLAVGALDLFADETFDYAQRLMRAGVPTEFHVYAGAFHGFDLSPGAAVSQSYRSDYLAALKRFFTGARVVGQAG